jgi:hypothetical protein
VDAKVYDMSKFKGLHPGGVSVLLDEDVGMYHVELFACSFFFAFFF